MSFFKGRPGRIALLVVSLLIAVFLVIGLSLGQVTKAGIEYFGSKILGVEVTVRTVFLSPFGGYCRISGLKVANPPGYSEHKLLEIGTVSASLDVTSLGSDPIRVKEVDINGMDVSWEGGNFSKIQANAEKYSGPSQKESKSFVIQKLRIKNARARIGGGSAIPIADMELNNVGNKNHGAAVKQVIETVLSSVAKAVTSEAVKKNLGGAGEAINDGLKKLFGR